MSSVVASTIHNFNKTQNDKFQVSHKTNSCSAEELYLKVFYGSRCVLILSSTRKQLQVIKSQGSVAAQDTAVDSAHSPITAKQRSSSLWFLTSAGFL